MELKTNYLPLATKRQIIETIKINALSEDEYNMKYIDYISLDLATDMTLLQFYFEEDLENIEMDELYKDGKIEYARSLIPASEIRFIEDHVMHMLRQEVETFNSLSGVINRNLSVLISKIPTEKGMNKIIKSIPKVLNSISPENLELLKNITGIDKQTMPNREQRRKAEKDKVGE